MQRVEYADFKIEQEDIIKNLQQKNETDNKFYQVRIHQFACAAKYVLTMDISTDSIRCCASHCYNRLYSRIILIFSNGRTETDPYRMHSVSYSHSIYHAKQYLLRIKR